MGNHQAPGFEHRIGHSFHIPGQDGTKVNHLTGNAFLLSALNRLVNHVHLGAPAKNGHVGAFLGDFCFTQGQAVIFIRYFAHGRPVKALGLKEQYRVGIVDGSQKQALGLVRVTWHHNLETRGVGEIGFRGLRVVKTAGNAAAIGRANGQSTDVEEVTRAIPVFRRFVHDLVEGREDVVGKLNLGDGHRALGGQAVGKTDNALFHQWCVETAGLSVFLL